MYKPVSHPDVCLKGRKHLEHKCEPWIERRPAMCEERPSNMTDLCFDIPMQDLLAVAVRQRQQQLHEPLPCQLLLYFLPTFPGGYRR